MKTSDPGAYSHIEQVTAGSTILTIRGLMLVHTSTMTIAGTTWEKQANSPDTYKSFSITVDLTNTRTLVLPLSVRTITSISAGTVYGMR